MNNYVRFDIESFLRDSKRWDAELKSLQTELDSIAYIKGAPDTPARSSEPSRPTESIAVERDRLMTRIDRLNEYKTVLGNCLDQISDHDRELIDGFFFGRVNIFSFVDSWCRKHASNTRYCYRDRRIALDHLRSKVEAYMYSHGYY